MSRVLILQLQPLEYLDHRRLFFPQHSLGIEPRASGSLHRKTYGRPTELHNQLAFLLKIKLCSQSNFMYLYFQRLIILITNLQNIQRPNLFYFWTGSSRPLLPHSPQWCQEAGTTTQTLLAAGPRPRHSPWWQPGPRQHHDSVWQCGYPDRHGSVGSKALRPQH